MRKPTVVFAGIIIIGALAGCQPKVPNPDALIRAGQQFHCRILRDEWGVPHVFGRTDADAAYGLAYAHCEDDFETIFEGLLAIRGQLSSKMGKEGAPIDYLVHLLRIWDTVSEKYGTVLSPEVRGICEAYAAGVNHYAALHQDEVTARGILPSVGQDIVAGFVLKAPFFFGVDNIAKELMGDKRKREIATKQVAQAIDQFFFRGQEIGSNTFAVAPSRSADGKTRIDINSHQPWDGPAAWYEAHVHSEEGWDCVGGVFPGTPVILHGHNRDLGWAHTVNSPDLVDVYVLTMNPDNPNQYQLDGQWYDLEVRQARIRVRVFGPISWTVTRECLWSPHHGPVVRQPHGVYAIRFGGMGDIRQVEQWYRMDKARNLSEFQDAMRMRAIASFNVGYADKEGNIWYLHNMAMPIRAEGYDWKKYLPGDTSETLWSEYLPLEKMPQVLNPASGFIQNCNNTPFQTTIGPENPTPEQFSPTCGLQTDMTNRGYRALELLGADESITRDEFLAYKFDVRYSPKFMATDVVREIAALPTQEDPVVQEAIDMIGKWDFSADRSNPYAAVAITVLTPIVKAQMFNHKVPDLLETVTENAHILHKAFGRLDVPWETVNRLRRGDVDLGLEGGPDTLRAVYGEGPGEDGCLVGMAGDCYILIAEWDQDGKVFSESIHQYGAATKDKNSSHYADQAPLFAACKLKPVWLDEADIRAHLEREYRPGDEVTAQ
ncbi:MAG TPA: acylase [Candidatus Hydrogenedentes bacterium]|nr:acylase [Candidatus Hydrogenedentota bacterium]HPG69479.1 acylase [Candidatus Hydrogenedentota bacterium]